MQVAVRGADPPPQKQYPYPKSAETAVQLTIKSLLQQSAIRECISTCNAPVWPVKKPDGSWRLTVDYRQLNKHTPSATPLVASNPDMMSQLRGSAKVCSTLDVSNGFWSIPVHMDSQYKFAFSFRDTQYTWVGLPQGFHNSPTLFHQCMANILQGCSQPHNVVQYVDDILLQSDTEEEHYELLDEILTLLEKAGLKLNPKKALLMKQSVCFLGVKIQTRRQIPDPAKVQLVQALPRPYTVTALRSFLGIVGFAGTL